MIKQKLDESGSIILYSTLTLPISIIEIPTENYDDYIFDDPSKMKNIALFDFNDKNLENVRFVKVNSMPEVREQLTPKYYVDQANFYNNDQLSLLRLDPDGNIKPNEQYSLVLKSTLTSPKTIIEIPTKTYVDSLHESSRTRHDLSSVFNDQDNEFDIKKLTNLDSVLVNGNRSSDNELSFKKHVDDSIGEGTIVGFNQSLQNDLKVSVGNDIYHLTKYDKIQSTDTTIFKKAN